MDAERTVIVKDVTAGGDVIAVAGDYMSAAEPALNQVPSPPADFTGRGEECAALIAAIRGGRSRIAIITGMGGAGKTSLALELVQQLRKDYPDAQLFVDARGLDATPLSVRDIMSHVIRSYDVRAAVPEDMNAVQGLYQSRLFGQRVVILIDNVVAQQRIEALLPPEGCLLVATSRERFALPGAASFDLGLLPPPASRQLLLRMCPRSVSRVDEIAQLCGYLPLAIRLAGSALQSRQDLPVDAYTERLRSERERLNVLDRDQPNGGIAASLLLTESLLEPELRARWPYLSLFVGTFDVAATSAVCGISLDSAQDTLSDLLRANLIEWNQITNRYWIHDLVRIYAARHLAIDLSEAASLRFASYYTQVLSRLERRYFENEEGARAALVQFDLEWPNIKAGFSWARERLPTNDDAMELCIRFCIWGATLRHMRQHPSEHIEWLNVAIKAARANGDLHAQAICLNTAGAIHVRQNEGKLASRYLRSAAAIMRELGDSHGTAMALGNLGVASLINEDFDSALGCYAEVLELSRTMSDTHFECLTYSNLGNVYASKGDRNRAISSYQKAVALAEKTRDAHGKEIALSNLAKAYVELGEFKQAIAHAVQSLELSRATGDRRGEATTSWYLSQAFEKKGDIESAIAAARVCFNYESEIGHPYAKSRAERIADLTTRLGS